jgi:glutathione peroxidase
MDLARCDGRRRNFRRSWQVEPAVSIYEDVNINSLDGTALDLRQFEGKATLVVNVASRCGLTPQYSGLEELHERFAASGFSVLGVPCNEFGGQEPGSADQIASFCSNRYGVTFRMTEKVEVNGSGRHPLYTRLVTTKDAQGQAGDIQWNFEKFLVSPTGEVMARLRPQTHLCRTRSSPRSSRYCHSAGSPRRPRKCAILRPRLLTSVSAGATERTSNVAHRTRWRLPKQWLTGARSKA